MAADMSTTQVRSSAAFLLADVHRFTLLRGDQSIHLLTFLLMNLADALLLLRRGERRVRADRLNLLPSLLTDDAPLFHR